MSETDRSESAFRADTHVELHLEAEDLCVRLVQLEDRPIDMFEHERNSLVRLEERVDVGLRNPNTGRYQSWVASTGPGCRAHSPPREHRARPPGDAPSRPFPHP